jgi:hypothetical protein
MTLMGRTMLLAGLTALATATLDAQVQTPKKVNLRQQILDELDLRDFEIQSFLMPAMAGPPIQTAVFLGDTEYQLEIERCAITTVDWEMWDIDELGNNIRDPDPPKSSTYKGSLIDPTTGDLVGHVRATVDEHMLWAMIWHDDGRSFGIQPIADAIDGYTPSEHVVYDTADVITAAELGYTLCGNDLLPSMRLPHHLIDEERDSAQQRALGDDINELAIDNGFEWYQANGTKKATVREAQKVINNTNGMYEVTGLDYTILISFFQNRFNGCGNYCTNNIGDLLDTTVAIWESGNQALAKRDNVHHFTGRNTGGILGVAFINNTCAGGGLLSGYGVSQVTFSANLANRGALVAHELGHNAGAGHCDGDADCGTMCSGFGGCPGSVLVFGNRSRNSINNFLGSVSCLHPDVADIVGPFSTDFESGIDPNIFQYNDGANSGTGAINEPSGIRSLVLNATSGSRFARDYIGTAEIRNAGTTSATVTFWYQVKGGASAARALTLRMLAASNNRKFEWGYDHDGVDQNTFTFVSHSLAYPQADHNNMTLYFEAGQACTGAGTGTVFVDDFTFTSTAASMAYNPGPNGVSQLRVFDAVPNQRVHFFANLAGQAMANNNTQIYPLGGATANASGVAVLELPHMDKVPSMEVGFFAILEMPNGGLQLQPIWVRL